MAGAKDRTRTRSRTPPSVCWTCRADFTAIAGTAAMASSQQRWKLSRPRAALTLRTSTIIRADAGPPPIRAGSCTKTFGDRTGLRPHREVDVGDQWARLTQRKLKERILKGVQTDYRRKHAAGRANNCFGFFDCNGVKLRFLTAILFNETPVFNVIDFTDLLWLARESVMAYVLNKLCVPTCFHDYGNRAAGYVEIYGSNP